MTIKHPSLGLKDIYGGRGGADENFVWADGRQLEARDRWLFVHLRAGVSELYV